MFYLYILKSEKHQRFYVGSTNDLTDRLRRHNAGYNKATRNGTPWKLIYSEIYSTRQEAYKRELNVKSYKGGDAFKKLLR